MSFDRLLNSNCSWSYKTMKTVTLEAKKGNNSLFKLQNTNITKNSVEKEGGSSLNFATSNFNEFENISDVNESKKSILNDGVEENEALTGLDCIPDSPYDGIISNENELICDIDKRIRSIDKSKASIKKSLNNTKRKSYAGNIDMFDASIKPLKNAGRKYAAKSKTKNISTSDARIKKALKNTECKRFAGSGAKSIDASDARIKKALNNAEHKSYAGSDLESVDMSDAISIEISLKNSDGKGFAGSGAKIKDASSNTKIEKALRDSDSKSSAGSDARSIDKSDARVKKALKNTERKIYAGSESISDVSIKKYLRNANRKSYAESDVESNAYSSSDEEAVLQTRICNEEGIAISNVSADNSNHAGEQKESFNDNNENLNNICLDYSDNSNLENELNEAFDKSVEKQEKSVIPINDNNSIVKPQVLNCKDSSRLEKSFSKKINPKRKSAAETSSFELSSLSEADDATDEIVNDVYVGSSNETKMFRERKTDSEIIQKCLDISTEVHSMCDTMESRETSTLNEIVHDFFNGTFDVNKYEINKISPTVSKESYETIQNGSKTEISNGDQGTNLSVHQTPGSFIINTGSDNWELSASPVKSVKRKSLETKQTPNKDLKNMKKKIPNSLKLPKNSFHDKQKSTVLSAKKSNSNKSLNSKLTTQITSEDTLFHKDQNSNKSVRNDEYHDNQRDEFTISYSPESPFFSESIQTPTRRNSLKRKSPNENLRQGHRSRVKQLSNEVSTNIDTNYKNRNTYKQPINSEKSKPPETVKTSITKRPKTWDDLENLYSEDAICHTDSLLRCQDEPIFTSKKSAFFSEPVINIPEITNKFNKKTLLQTHTENEYPALSSSPQNRSRTIKTLTPKNTSERNNELALISPNANIIDKIIKNMEKCTQPYLSSSKKKQSTLLNGLEPTNDINKSPMVTEYSYSIKEIQSTILVTTGKTKKKVRNVVHRDETKSQICKVAQQKSLANKNCQVKKQETAFESWSLLKDSCDENPSNKINLNTPRRTPNKYLNKESGSKENTKPSVLNNILARLEVGDYTHDNGRDNNCVDSGQQTKLLTHKNKETPDLENSISKINTFSAEQGHYNLRKRKVKNNLDEIENIQINKKLSIYDQCDNANTDSVANSNSSNTKSRMYWNDKNTDVTDSSCEIIDIPKQKRDERKTHRNRKTDEVGKFKTLSSKPENSHTFLDKKKATQSGKKEWVLLPSTSSMLSNYSEESDSEGTIYEFNDINTHEINNKTRTNSKRRLLSKENILEKSSSESGWENFDYSEKSNSQMKINQNKNQLKIAENRNSKSNLGSNTNSNKKYVNSEKTETTFTPYQNSSKKNGTVNFDDQKKLVRSVDKTKNTLQKKNEFLSMKITPIFSGKNPSNKTQDLHSVKDLNLCTHFAQEPKKLSPNLQIRPSSKKMSEKCKNEDSYKRYLETIFKNSNKTSTHRSTSSWNQAQMLRENALSEDSDENEFFSLSSSDSDDFKASTPKPSLGLLGDTLCESE